MSNRRSVRTYDGKLISESDREKLQQLIDRADNPYNIPIEYRFLEPGKHDLKSPVLSGETLYLAGKMKRVPHFEEAFGYSLESIVLGACELGIGTVWIGGTMNREKFEEAMELQPDEVMPCVTPVGYPAKKNALRENMMRKGVKADWRYDLSQIISEDEVGKPLSEGSMKLYGQALEMVRWAPSAVNKQPWRIIIKENHVHFYEKPDKGYVSESTGDLQKIDVGIAMYHFVLGMGGDAASVEFFIEDPKLPVPAEWQYIASYRKVWR